MRMLLVAPANFWGTLLLPVPEQCRLLKLAVSRCRCCCCGALSLTFAAACCSLVAPHLQRKQASQRLQVILVISVRQQHNKQNKTGGPQHTVRNSLHSCYQLITRPACISMVSRQLTALYGLVAAVAHPLFAAGRFCPPGCAAAVPASACCPHASKRLVALKCQAGLRA